jgi:hypothetical protein
MNNYKIQPNVSQWRTDASHKQADELTHDKLVGLITNKINAIDFDDAKNDVVDFLKDKSAIALWSASFFIELTMRLKSTRLP